MAGLGLHLPLSLVNSQLLLHHRLSYLNAWTLLYRRPPPTSLRIPLWHTVIVALLIIAALTSDDVSQGGLLAVACIDLLTPISNCADVTCVALPLLSLSLRAGRCRCLCRANSGQICRGGFRKQVGGRSGHGHAESANSITARCPCTDVSDCAIIVSANAIAPYPFLSLRVTVQGDDLPC